MRMVATVPPPSQLGTRSKQACKANMLNSKASRQARRQAQQAKQQAIQKSKQAIIESSNHQIANTSISNGSATERECLHTYIYIYMERERDIGPITYCMPMLWVALRKTQKQ